MSLKRNHAFCLIDERGNVMIHTLRQRRLEVPSAALDWSGYEYDRLRIMGYRIAKVKLVVVASP